MGMMNWLMNHVFDREGYRDMQEALENLRQLEGLCDGLAKHPMYPTAKEIEAIKARHVHLFGNIANHYPPMGNKQ